jgi:hypothetical protein
VTPRDGVLYCSLTFERTYDLVEAYGDDLHVRFANAQTDEDLISFLEDWGPLWLNPEQAQSGVMSLPLAYCCAFRRWLRALVDLLAAFKRVEGECAALQEFVEAEYEKDSASTIHLNEPPSIAQLRILFGISGDVVDWVKQASLSAVRSATDAVLPLFVVGGTRLSCIRRAGRPIVEAKWVVDSLEEALSWMAWYDEFTQHPIVCCQECRTVFRAETAHARKYCGHDCAHRATARVWQRNKRLANRSSKTRAKQRARRK